MKRLLILYLSVCVSAFAFANDGYSAHDDHATIENVSLDQSVMTVDTYDVYSYALTLRNVDLLPSVHVFELNFAPDVYIVLDNYRSISLRTIHVQNTRAGPVIRF